jgi:hypothetical protein
LYELKKKQIENKSANKFYFTDNVDILFTGISCNIKKSKTTAKFSKKSRNKSLSNHNVLFLCFFMMFNATFNNISVISWQSVLLVEETGVPGENY